jgi:hypothetical protein
MAFTYSPLASHAVFFYEFTTKVTILQGALARSLLSSVVLQGKLVIVALDDASRSGHHQPPKQRKVITT